MKISALSGRGMSPVLPRLHVVASADHALAHLLLRAGVKADQVEVAIAREHHACARELLNAGASVEPRDEEQAAVLNDHQMARLLQRGRWRRGRWGAARAVKTPRKRAPSCAASCAS